MPKHFFVSQIMVIFNYTNLKLYNMFKKWETIWTAWTIMERVILARDYSIESKIVVQAKPRRNGTYKIRCWATDAAGRVVEHTLDLDYVVKNVGDAELTQALLDHPQTK